jgi:hypothetical protein
LSAPKVWVRVPRRARLGSPTGRGTTFRAWTVRVRLPLQAPRSCSPTGRGARLKPGMLRVRLPPRAPPTVSPFGRGAQRAMRRCASNAADGRCRPASGTTQSPGPWRSRATAAGGAGEVSDHDDARAASAASAAGDRLRRSTPASPATTNHGDMHHCRRRGAGRLRPARRARGERLHVTSADRPVREPASTRHVHDLFHVAWSANPSNC